mmetsp:Transcript_35616/g.106288  ORF Transcript_35616/g.106288 Transcript_35616/m.106288 type:complete len:395 (-) Transcript_35616:527-1711(-)
MTKVKRTRHYYSTQQSFEQSLDVYKPVDPHAVLEDDEDASLPLVVLVVGSGWLGHRAFIYAATSWWNSAGPQSLARLGCVCVCVRHRGAFFVIPEARTVISLLLVASAVIYAVWGLFAAFVTTALLALIWALLAVGARGSAKFEDMQHDVADGLAWVHRYKDKEELVLTKPPNGVTSSEQAGQLMSKRALVFGGYSSGGHVASTVLQRPAFLKSKGLPPAEKVCDAVLLISGVLAVRPLKEEPSLPRASKDARPPNWLTDLTMQIVFGKENSSLVPSPIEGTKPNLPHVLIGCAEEVFGLDWLDVFFCSSSYNDALERVGIPSRYIKIKSDHWNILRSREFSKVALDELQLISNGYASTKAAICDICQRNYCVRVRSGGAVSPSSLLCRDIRQQ